MWPTATAPTGYLKCDGTYVSRTTYAGLFGVIGTTFGTNLVTNFRLPDYTNRFPIGVGTTAALAGVGGSADTVVVSHTHTATTTVTDPGHTHTHQGYLLGSPGSSLPWYNWANSNKSADQPIGTSTTGITVGVTNSTEGQTGTGKNLPPYLGINFIIKT
jgi:microcystin-dependent protein